LAQRHLSEQELHIVNCRRAGSDWRDIARELDSTPEAVRKRFTRAMDRVMHKLGLDDPDHE
jgi:DNA-binding NarL/FixJ family response regulator